LAIIESAESRSAQHSQWKRDNGGAYNGRLEALAYSLSSKGHFRVDRLDTKKTAVDVQGVRFKKPNTAQQVKPQQNTSAVTGRIAYGKLTKKRNMQDMEVELLHRGVDQGDVPTGITDRKALLKELETKRLVEVGGMPQAEAEEQKAFLVLSSAEFKLTDD